MGAVVAALAVVVAATGTAVLARPAPAAAASGNLPGTVSGSVPITDMAGARSTTPLLLVHGYTDWCSAAFNHTADRFGDAADVRAVPYLTAHGFTDVRTVGYYDTDADSIAGGCTVNVQRNAGPSAVSGCGNTGYNGDDSNDPIVHLACLFAWYVAELNRPVDILAHSMGGLIVRTAMYYSTHSGSGYAFPGGPLNIRRVVTVGSPHDGLQGMLAYVYNQTDGSGEVRDMTVCPGYADTCTLTPSLFGLNGPPVTLSTSSLMKTLKAAGKPKGSAGDTFWGLIGSSVSCDNPLDQRDMPTCWLARKSVNLDPYSGTDWVVQSDSSMGMPADYKVMYGNVEYWTSGPFPTVYNSGGVSYTHEADTCQNIQSIVPVPLPNNGDVCTTAQFFLNDGSSAMTGAFVCTSACVQGSRQGMTDVPFFAAPTSHPRALAMMAELLLDPPVAQIGHAAHAGDDYPYAGQGLFNRNEGIDGWTEFYGQCDSFAAWKVYENLGGAQRPDPATVPAVGWQPSDRAISPVVSYAGRSDKTGTWGDAHDWIRNDNGVHAAPYFHVPFDDIPQPGAIAVWRNTSEDPTNGMSIFGHVAYVTDVIDANTIIVEGYNLFGNGLWSADRITRSGGAVDNAFGRSIAFGWPAKFVHLGDGPVGPAAGLPSPTFHYPVNTFGPTSATGTGTAFALAGADYAGSNQDVHGWYRDSGHGEIGNMFWTYTRTGTADSTATWSPTLATASACYAVDVFVPDHWSNSAFALYTVTDAAFGTSVVPVDENVYTNQFARLGVFKADASRHITVKLTDQGSPNGAHQVAADGVRFVRQSGCATARTGVVIDPATPDFTRAGAGTNNGWTAQPGHGLRGNLWWTLTNGVVVDSTATYTAHLPVGCYRVEVFVPDMGSNSPAALYTVNDQAFGSTLGSVDENAFTNEFTALGIFNTRPDGTIQVTLTDQNPTGRYVGADAVKFTPANCSFAARFTLVIDPVTPGFSLAGPTVGNGDSHGWYTRAGHGLRGNERWTYAAGTTAISTATWAPAGLPLNGGCYNVRAFVPDNYANNTGAGYLVAVDSPGSGYGVWRTFNQNVITNNWIDLGKFAIPSGGWIHVTVDDTAPGTTTVYTAADAVDFRLTTGC